MDELNKNIDEKWKDSMEKEKQETQKKEEEFIPIDPDFKFFVTTLALQASIALGQIANPATNQKEENPAQAKFIIDTLNMLKEKTNGNLTKEEEAAIEDVLYELRMQFIAKNKKGEKND